MPKRYFSKEAFTLIEVMVAVMIISLVIAALLEMQGNTTFKFLQIKEMMHSNQYNSFLLSQDAKYGFENEKLDMKRLVDDFDLESDLRRELKDMKVEIVYEELSTIDTNEFMDNGSDEEDNGEESEEQSASGIIFEIGKTTLKTEKFDGHLIRVRVQ